jgi:hypothetical protein
MTYVDCTAPPANCAGAAGPTRAMARRLWCGHSVPAESVVAAGKKAQPGLNGRAGRVESKGSFEHPGFGDLIRSALPSALGRFLRARLEWYACRGAFFHNDAHYDGVLFGVWCVLGPPRELVFPRLNARLPAAVGDLCLFDPFEPHGVLRPGATTYDGDDYAAAEPSLFLGFEIELASPVRTAFGIEAPAPGRPTYSSRIAIHPVTGARVTSDA